MPLMAWVLSAVVAAILVTLYALPWLSVFQAAMKARPDPPSRSLEVVQLAAELSELEAKHPPHPDGS